MKLKRLLLSEYARNHAGKLDVLGILGGFMPAQLPFQAEYYVVLDLEAEDEDLDQECLVSIVMIDPDGKNLSKVEVSFAVNLQNFSPSPIRLRDQEPGHDSSGGKSPGRSAVKRQPTGGRGNLHPASGFGLERLAA